MYFFSFSRSVPRGFIIPKERISFSIKKGDEQNSDDIMFYLADDDSDAIHFIGEIPTFSKMPIKIKRSINLCKSTSTNFEYLNFLNENVCI